MIFVMVITPVLFMMIVAPVLLMVLIASIFALMACHFMIRQVPPIAGHHAVQFVPTAKYVSTTVPVGIEALIAATIAVNAPDKCITVKIHDVGRSDIGDIHIKRIGGIFYDGLRNDHAGHADNNLRLDKNSAGLGLRSSKS